MDRFNRNEIGFLILILLVTFSQVVVARDYKFSQLIINLEVNPDGSYDVHERRTVIFDGQYEGLFQWLDLLGGISVSNVVVAENGVDYVRNTMAKPGPPGTYFVEYEADRIYIDWSFLAQDEERTFDVSYKIDNGILVHEDFAELYHKFIGEGWEKGVDHVLVNLYLPGPTDMTDLRAWGHGPLHGHVTIVDEEHVQWEISPLPPLTMLEGRVLFAKDVVHRANIFTGKSVLKEVLREEQAFADAANLKRLEEKPSQSWNSLGKGLLSTWLIRYILTGKFIIIMITNLLIAILLWVKYGREFKPDFRGEYCRELPANYSPAELGVLWSMGNVRTQDFTATLMDLARRRYIRIDEKPVKIKGIFRDVIKTEYFITPNPHDGIEKGTLRDHEKQLLNFLFSRVVYKQTLSEKETLSFSDIEKYARNNPRRFTGFWKEWQSKVENAAKSHDFFDKPGIYLQGILALLGCAYLFFSFLGGTISFTTIDIIVGCIISGLAFIVTAVFIRRRSPSGSTDYAKWKAFKGFLDDFSEMHRHDIPALIIWEHYLVYAITLGSAKRVIDQLQLVYPNLDDGERRFGYGWYYYSGMAQVISLHAGLTLAMEKSITAATSSGAGRGGGFSSGGGGGTGGGGGGAR